MLKKSWKRFIYMIIRHLISLLSGIIVYYLLIIWFHFLIMMLTRYQLWIADFATIESFLAKTLLSYADWIWSLTSSVIFFDPKNTHWRKTQRKILSYYVSVYFNGKYFSMPLYLLYINKLIVEPIFIIHGSIPLDEKISQSN